jgi:cell division protein FtsW (lipid II flippase)
MIAAQTLVIVGGVTGFIPLTGITLPFVSYGGTSLIISFLALGIIQKVSEGDETEAESGQGDANE